MKYYSTVNKSESVDFREALFNGLAPDGGLYLPEKIPKYNSELFTPELTYPEFAYNILKPYVSLSIPNNYLNNIYIERDHSYQRENHFFKHKNRLREKNEREIRHLRLRIYTATAKTIH